MLHHQRAGSKHQMAHGKHMSLTGGLHTISEQQPELDEEVLGQVPAQLQTDAQPQMQTNPHIHIHSIDTARTTRWRLCASHSLSMLAGASRLSLESIQ